MKYLSLFPKEKAQWISLIIRWSIISLLLISAFSYMTRTPGTSYSGPLKPLSHEEKQIRDNLERHVKMLSDTIGERNVRSYEQLKASGDYISAALKQSGFALSYQKYAVEGKTVENIEGEISGISNPAEIIVIGAHYDSATLCPGANDNASGVAALLETARILAGRKFAKTLRFVAFVNEEPPYFQTNNMGSRVYAARSRQRGEKIAAMLSLETIGSYSDEKGSRNYPPPPSTFLFGYRKLYRVCKQSGVQSIDVRYDRPYSEKMPGCPLKASLPRDGSRGLAGRITGHSGKKGIMQ